MTNEKCVTGGAANILRPSIGDLMQASNESAVVEEGKEYERKRQGGDAQQQQGGDWWRDEMASGKEGRV